MSVGLPTQGATTASYWLQGDANPLAQYGSNSSFTHEDIDVLVIGSGITGVSFVHHLVQALTKEPRSYTDAGSKLKVTLVEARDFCSGATGRNGGHLLTLPYDGFTSRSRRTDEPPSESDGVRNALLEMATVKKIRDLIDTHGWASDVHLGSHGHTRIFLTPEEEEEDLEEYNAAKNAGVPWDGIRRYTKEEMIEKFGVPYPGVSIPAGSIWPVKFVTKLFELAKSEAPGASVDLSLHTHTTVEAVEAVDLSSTQTKDRFWAVRTSRGVLRTRFVIYASNGWTAHLLPQFVMPEDDAASEGSEPQPKKVSWIAPYRGQMVATRANVPASELPERAFASDWMEDYWLPSPLSRTSPDNALILLGGGRDEENEDSELGVSDDASLNPRIVKSLRGVLPRAFPQYFDKDKDPEMVWSGIMGFTDTEDPIVGPVPSPHSQGRHFLPGQYIAAGYSGHGMSRAFSCAEALANMVLREMRGESPSAPDWLPRSFSTISS